jgi:hypothetical protein
MIPDPDVPVGEAIVTSETEYEDVTFRGALAGRYVIAQRPEVRVPVAMTDGQREDLLRQLSRAYNVPLCAAVGEHKWTPWTHDRDRDWWARECQRQDCDHASAVSGRLVRSGEHLLVGDVLETDPLDGEQVVRRR